ncbi:MAG: hypothetical protein QOI05_388 [Bradyrhizobium sp.]|jgi:subtilisin family serine protease|nr:hypothetical protein [Bradyrhizobium sp.]
MTSSGRFSYWYLIFTAIGAFGFISFAALAQQPAVRFDAGVAADLAPPSAKSSNVALQAAPTLAPRILRLNISIRSPADLAEVKSELEAVAERVIAVTDRVIYVESTRMAELGQVIRSNGKIEYVEKAYTLSRAPIESPPLVDFDVDAQFSHNVPALRQNYGLSGEGVGVAVWDEGQVLSTHVEFEGRLTVHDTATNPRAHSTHVAGIIAAQGVQPRAEGMAPKAKVHSFDWDNDIKELMDIAKSDPTIFVTNHSYGASRGWNYASSFGSWVWDGDPRINEDEDHFFGKYTLRSQIIDEVIFDYPRMSVFVSAGNKRGAVYNPTILPQWHGRHWLSVLDQYVTRVRKPDSQHDGGYDTLEGFALAKNVITIGAVEDIPREGLKDPSNVKVTEFSSWGPTDDGRIKPDLVANGAQLLAPTADAAFGTYDARAYVQMSGTSMASPAAAGVAVLLTELSIKKRGKPLRADEMKSILINTAVSPTKGPNYRTGWGAIDALAAGRLLVGEEGALIAGVHSGNNESHVIRAKSAGGPISVTLVWLDPPATPNDSGLNDPRPDLVHNLDLIVTSASGVRHYPWSLDPGNPGSCAARTKPNTLDNVEQVDIDSAPANELWTINVAAPKAAEGVRFAVSLRGASVLEQGK